MSQLKVLFGIYVSHSWIVKSCVLVDSVWLHETVSVCLSVCLSVISCDWWCVITGLHVVNASRRHCSRLWCTSSLLRHSAVVC